MKYFLHDGKLIVVGETGEVSVLNELVIPESAEVSGGGNLKRNADPIRKSGVRKRRE